MFQLLLSPQHLCLVPSAQSFLRLSPARLKASAVASRAPVYMQLRLPHSPRLLLTKPRQLVTSDPSSFSYGSGRVFTNPLWTFFHRILTVLVCNDTSKDLSDDFKIAPSLTATSPILSSRRKHSMSYSSWAIETSLFTFQLSAPDFNPPAPVYNPSPPNICGTTCTGSPWWFQTLPKAVSAGPGQHWSTGTSQSGASPLSPADPQIHKLPGVSQCWSRHHRHMWHDKPGVCVVFNSHLDG